MASAATSRAARWTRSIRSGRHEDKVLLLLTLIIGAVVGLVVVAFILLTETLSSHLYPAKAAAWRRLVMPIAGALLTGFFLSRYFPGARGSGIPQTKAALFIRDGYISLRTVLGKFCLSSVSLASGIALGREGPSVQVGAGIASVLGRELGLSQTSIKALVPIGASAALAAAFNTPIAAVLFSLEEVMGDMHAPVLGSIVLSSATAWIVLHLILGDEPLFHVPAYQLVHPIEFLVYAVLGVIGGLVSVAFVKLLLWQRKWFKRLPKRTDWLQPAVGGVTVGLIGWFVPQVLGVGYEFVGQALNGQILVATMAMLVCLKIVATATCYSSGNAGGIFGPSLFMGAMMGGAVGGAAHMLLPDYTGGVGAYALVGMGAAFAGIIRVPMTSVIMIFEITRDYSIIVPLMIANLISYFISSQLQEEPIYEALQHQDGVHLPSGAKARQALLMVGNGYRRDAQILAADQTIAAAAASVDRERGAWPVVDQNGLRGMISVEQLDAAVQAGRGGETLAQLAPEPGQVETLTEENFPHLHIDHLLDVAMQRLAESGLKALPVVSRANLRELKGTISLADILNAYGIGQARQPVAASQTTEPMQASNRLLVGVVAALMAIALLAGFLNYYYRARETARALEDHRQGEQLLASGNFDEAIARFRDALSISHSVQDRLALGLALAKADRGAEASIYLSEVLRAQPASGPANLGLAQIEAAEGEIDIATLHYHRAMYGAWPDKPEDHRLQTRLELARMLASHGRTAPAQAELLAAAAAAPADPAVGKQVGRMLIDAGMPKNAADVFRGILNRDPRDDGAEDGLGDAWFSLGDYPQALEAYRAAVKLNPTDMAAAKRAEECERILALDPGLRGLAVAERYARSQKILSEVADEVTRCAGGNQLSEAVQSELKDAATALARKRPPSFTDAAESNVALAERMWEARGTCPAGGDEVLGRVMARLLRR